MPATLQVEAGFEKNADEVSNLTSQGSSDKKRTRTEAHYEEVQRRCDSVDNALLRVADMLDRKQTSTPARATTTTSDMIDKVAALSKKLKEDDVLSTMSPETEREYLEAIRTERRDLLEDMKKSRKKK